MTESAGVITSQQVVRLLAEDGRRRVVAALELADGSSDTAALAHATGLALREVVDALDRLVSGGLVEQSGSTFRLRREVFARAARTEAPERAPSAYPDESPDRARVLDAAFRDQQLVQWPSKRNKRLIVLDHMSQLFDIGKRYSEAAVNEHLRRYGDDVATMRRYLVDEQFLDRSGGEYWRCGGSV